MNIEGGFHPWQRLVRRLGRIAPHRQIQLLFAISTITVVIMVAAVLSSLSPTRDSLSFSSETLTPAINRLDATRESYAAASTAVQLAIDTDPIVRAGAISKVAALHSNGEAAWKEYLLIAAHLPGERALQRSFVAHRKAALDAGVTLVSEPATSAASLADVTRSTEALRVDLNRTRSLYEVRVGESLTGSRAQVGDTQRQILLVSGSALLVLAIAFGVAARSARSREDRLEGLDRALHEDAERNELEAQLQHALEMARTEADAFAVAGRALSMKVADLPAELLVADSSRGHFRQAISTDDHGGPGCPAASPTDCPAATWGQTQLWTSSSALDACPFLDGRPNGACSAVCVPLSIGGKSVGVVHATGPDMHPPDEHVVARVELIVRKVVERVGLLRAFMRSETQAHTDPLTGLMNRRSFEAGVAELVEGAHSYVAAYADLDHFKQVNDDHGHDAGDQALRLFARVLRDTVRPNDLTSRYGGEEFVVLLPDCSISDAVAVVERIRERLALAQISASGPRFTVSFGLALSRPEHTFSETLEVADAALREAKANGRDRVVVAGSGASGKPTSPAELGHAQLEA